MKALRRLRLKFPRFRAALLLGFLLLLLVGLFGQTQVNNINQHYQIIEQLRELERSHLTIKADTLKARFSIFHNYDVLTADSAAFDNQLKTLESALSQLPNAYSNAHFSIQEKLADIEAQSALRHLQLEDLKSENAVLKNSTAYFPIAMKATIEQLSNDDSASRLTAPLNKIFQLILMYCLDNALADPAEIQQMMAASVLPPVTDNVFRHAEAILRLQGEVNQFVNLLSSEEIDSSIKSLTLAYEGYHRQVTETKNRYRLYLFMVAVMVVIYSGFLAWTKQNIRILRAVNSRLSDAVNEKTQALKETIAQLKRSQVQLIQAEKMSGLGQLSAGIAHEINNPISFIYGNINANTSYSQDCLKLISLYEKHYPEPTEEIKEFTEEIEFDFLKQDWKNLLKSMKTGTQRVKDIVESLRNFSRLDEAEYKTVDLHEGLDSSLLLLNHRLASITPTIKIIKHYGQLPPMLCHASAINQVFINLLGNAIDALQEDSLKENALKENAVEENMPEEKALTTEATITVTTYTEANYAIIKITDNGIGISNDDQKKIFDPFFTTKPIGEGTGLGLTVSYQTIVEGHHGHLIVASIPGEHTTFQIELPIEVRS
ncbi:MAG: DAHL domain-containing protein [Cyanobacteria bacterium P01_D01_bin.105]